MPVGATGGTASSFLDLLSGEAVAIGPEVPAVDLPAWGARVLRRGTGGGTK